MTQKTQSTNNEPVFTYHHPDGSTQEVVFVVYTYVYNGNLYVGLEDARTGETFAEITRNPTKLDGHIAHIKNVDENEGMVEFLIDNKIGILLGSMEERYPLFMFNPSKLAEVNTFKQK